MKHFFKGCICLFILAIMTAGSGCRKKAFDEYYGIPENLPKSIYTVLESRNNFTGFLKLIDKAGYKEILSTAGYWTLFAANDSALGVYLKENSIASVDAIDSITAQKIVRYSLVYNGYKKENLDDYQSTIGWVYGTAFKRRTTYYTGFYADSVRGKLAPVLASNRNNNSVGFSYNVNDNNNKYITYFTTSYMTTKQLSAADYNYFYPNSVYTGFNVMDAAVKTEDIPAENGYIHEVNRVLIAMPSIDEYLTQRATQKQSAEFGYFKSLYDKYMVQYLSNADATKKYQINTGKTDSAYIKAFNFSLAYSPNNENFVKLQDNDGQQDGWSIFVPQDAPAKNYVNTVLLENYKSFDSVPPQIIIDFLNAHMFNTTVWPTKFSTTTNTLGEEARFDRNADVVEKKILSNGIFYGTNKVQLANVFTTVYGKPYLDPKYTFMIRVLDDIGLKTIITNPNLKYTIFMISNDAFTKSGFGYNSLRNEYTYTPASEAGTLARNRLIRLLQTHVVPTPKGELNSLADSGIVETYGGEFIKYKNKVVTAAGNFDKNTIVNAPTFKTANNGLAYYSDSILTYSENKIGFHIRNLGIDPASPFNYFYRYLASSSLYTAATFDITGVQPGAFYTVYIPDNAAIQKAVTDGLLPATAGLPNFTPTDPLQQELVRKFILYHITNRTAAANGGDYLGGYTTLLQNNIGDFLTINITTNTKTSMVITDQTLNRKANVIMTRSNNLSNRCLIHLVDNYFKYN